MIHMKSPIEPIVPWNPVDWLDDISLREAFKHWFPECLAHPRNDKPRAVAALTVVRLRKFHGVHVWWTLNFEDYLEY